MNAVGMRRGEPGGADWTAQNLQGGGEAAFRHPGGLSRLLPGTGARARAVRRRSGKERAGAADLVGAPLAERPP